MENPEILYYAKLSLVLFVAILFTQSGLDKVIDFKGNKAYIQLVFEKSFLHRFSGLMFISITILEVSTGLCALVGIFSLFLFKSEQYAVLALLLASATILALFAGQRIAKDYGGASGIVPYFIVVVFGLFLFAS